MKYARVAGGAAIAVAGSLAFALPALAAANISNGSFESGTSPGAYLTVPTGGTAIDNWSVDSGNVDYVGSYWAASDGARSIDLNGSTAGTLSQSFATTPGATYKVTFDLSGNPASGPADKALSVNATGGTSTAYHYDTSVEGNTLSDMKWQPQSYTFTAPSATTTLSFASQTTGAYGPALDNVAITELYVTPLDANQCKKGGWQSLADYSGTSFKNQGDCVSFVATGGTNTAAGN